MPLPNVNDFLARVDKGQSYAAKVSADTYVLYYKQYSPIDGSHMAGEDQVIAVSLPEMDARIAALQAEIDTVQALKDSLAATKVTAEQINKVAETAQPVEVVEAEAEIKP